MTKPPSRAKYAPERAFTVEGFRERFELDIEEFPFFNEDLERTGSVWIVRLTDDGEIAGAYTSIEAAWKATEDFFDN